MSIADRRVAVTTVPRTGILGSLGRAVEEAVASLVGGINKNLAFDQDGLVGFKNRGVAVRTNKAGHYEP